MKPRGRPPHPDILTPREWEVLDLVAEGLSNGEIAERLTITENGVKYHVSEILSRLGVTSRQEAAAWRLSVGRRTWMKGLIPLVAWLKGAPAARLAAGAVLLGTVAGLILFAWATSNLAREDRVVVDRLGKIAYVAGGDVWSKALPHGLAQQLTHGAGLGETTSVRWSSSGEWLLAGASLLLRAEDGKMTDLKAACVWQTPATADTLICRELIGERYGPYFRLDPGTRAHQELALPVGGGVSWGLDGTLLAYVVDGPWISPAPAADGRVSPKGDSSDSRMSALWLADVDGSGAREVFSNDGFELGGGQVILRGWTAVGPRVLFYLNPAFAGSGLNDGLPLLAYTPSTRTVSELDLIVLAYPSFIDERQDGLLAVAEGVGRFLWSGKAISLVDLATGKVARLTSDDRVSISPSWSPDGSRIAYASGPDAGMVDTNGARASLAQRRVWIMDADGANQHRLTDREDCREEQPRWSSDGLNLLFGCVSSEGARSLWLVDADGADLRPVVTIDAEPSIGRGAWLWADQIDWWQPR